MKKLFHLVILVLIINQATFSQVSIGTTEPDSSAVLELKSEQRGFLPPRLTGVQRDAILNPAAGLMIFCIDCGTGTTGELQVFNGAEWTNLTGGATTAPWVCGNPLIDTRNSTSYATVLISTQCWMAEDMNVGDRIDGNNNQLDNAILEKYCYNDMESNCDIYGGLYQWDEMMQYTTQQGTRGICPLGWHVPTDAEWTTLTDYVSTIPDFWCSSNSTYIAKSLAATTNWFTTTNTCAIGNNLAANNATAFTALPTGGRSNIGTFSGLDFNVSWWSSTVFSSSNAWRRTVSFSGAIVSRYQSDKANGYSLRCVKD